MAYFIPALIFLSAVVITLSLMLLIKIAQAVAENSHRVGLCVCVCDSEKGLVGEWKRAKGTKVLRRNI